MFVGDRTTASPSLAGAAAVVKLVVIIGTLAQAFTVHESINIYAMHVYHRN